MRRLLYVVAGFVGGVVVSRNAAAMPGPVASAVVVGALVLAGVAWFSGVRDKKAAVAVAVAKATATAVAAAESRSAAVASSQVHLHMGAGGVVDRESAPSSEAPARLTGRHATGQIEEQHELRHEYADALGWPCAIHDTGSPDLVRVLELPSGGPVT